MIWQNKKVVSCSVVKNATTVDLTCPFQLGLSADWYNSAGWFTETSNGASKCCLARSLTRMVNLMDISLHATMSRDHLSLTRAVEQCRRGEGVLGRQCSAGKFCRRQWEWDLWYNGTNMTLQCRPGFQTRAAWSSQEFLLLLTQTSNMLCTLPNVPVQFRAAFGRASHWCRRPRPFSAAAIHRTWRRWTKRANHRPHGDHLTLQHPVLQVNQGSTSSLANNWVCFKAVSHWIIYQCKLWLRNKNDSCDEYCKRIAMIFAANIIFLFA